MLRGNCHARYHCRFCDSIVWSTFEVGFLDHPSEYCRVGDNVSDELVGLWRRYAVVRYPDATGVRIVEQVRCASCESDLWICLRFESGVLASVSAVPLTAHTLSEVHYVSRRVANSFEQITSEPFVIEDRRRSDWPALLSRRAHDEVWAKGRRLRAQRWEDGFLIDGDYGGAWTTFLRACALAGALDGLGASDQVIEIGGTVVGPASSMNVPGEIEALRGGIDADDWAMRRGEDEWAFVPGPQLRAMAAGAAVLMGAPWSAKDEDPMLYRDLERGLRLVERVSATRYRALARDGRAALVDVDPATPAPAIADEPSGVPLGTVTVPLLTQHCGAIGSQLAAWALQRTEGWRVLFELADVYATFEPRIADVTGVVPGRGRDYAPPEVLERGPLMAAGDVFTICAIVAHLATGEHPFDGGERGILEERRRAFWGDPRIARIVDRGLDRDPARRGTLEQLRDDFDKLGEGR